jgi:hypothetical protein
MGQHQGTIQGANSIAQMQFKPGVSVAFDADAFDDAIRAHGVEFVHYRGMRNPAGMVEKFDSRRPGEDHVGASNGLVYTRAGHFIALLTSNSKDLRAAADGQMDDARAQMTPTRFYEPAEAGEPSCECQPELIYLSPMDRLYLRDETVMVISQQLVEAHRTGLDRLRFPAIKVQDLMDADGHRYQQGVDFLVEDGNIRWTGANRPGLDDATGEWRGKVYGIRYLYRPFWYVERMVHEIRVAQGTNGSGERITQSMPQSVFVVREHVFRNEKQDEKAPDPDSPRQVAAPTDGGFGPR